MEAAQLSECQGTKGTSWRDIDPKRMKNREKKIRGDIWDIEGQLANVPGFPRSLIAVRDLIRAVPTSSMAFVGIAFQYLIVAVNDEKGGFSR